MTGDTSKPHQVADADARSLGRGRMPHVGDHSLGRVRVDPGSEPTRSPVEYAINDGSSK